VNEFNTMATTKPYVLIVGAGKTGQSIIEGLLSYGGYRIGALVRPESVTKPDTLKLKEKGVEIVVGDILQADKLDLSGVNILISAIHFTRLLDQLPLIKAAKAAGVNRFIPCDWGTACPPISGMVLREQKEVVRQATKDAQIPYTFIDVGWWYQVTLPSDLQQSRFGNGDVRTALTDLHDIGKFVARILHDDRTIGKYIFCWAEELSQDEILKIANTYSKKEEKWQNHISAEEIKSRIKELREIRQSKAQRPKLDEDLELVLLEYGHNKYISGDNTVKRAKELGALDAQELYPGIKLNSFTNFVKEKYSKPDPEGKVANEIQ